MILFFPGVLLLLQPYIILRVEGTGQRFQVDAHEYNTQYRVNLKLGDCPYREIIYPNDTRKRVECPYKHTGDEYFIPLSQASFDVKQVKTNEDGALRMGGGITIGASLAGLISAEVKGSVMSNIQTNNKQLTLTSVYRLQRGVKTLRNARPAGPLPPNHPTELYLSEIVYGGTEMVSVIMEFSSEKTKTEVELTVTVKILWISLSAKLSYISESFNASASVKVFRTSTWRGEKLVTFEGPDSLKKAAKMVEQYEKEINEGPAEMLKIPLDDKRLHAEYHFSRWARSRDEEELNEALTIERLKVLIWQIVELETILKKIEAFKNHAIKKLMYSLRSSDSTAYKVSQNQFKELVDYKSTIAEKNDKLLLAYGSYFLMTQLERERIPDIYGRFKAPFYYTRKLNAIYQPGNDFHVS